MMNLRWLNILLYSVFIVLDTDAQSVLFTGKEANDLFEKAVELRYDENRELPSYVSFGKDRGISEGVFFKVLSEQLDLAPDFSFQLDFQSREKSGIYHKTYSQHLNGYKVVYSHLKVHTYNDKVFSFNGNFVNVTPEAKNATITKDAAFKKALDIVGATEYYGKFENYLNYGQEKGNGKLVYLPTFQGKVKNSIELVYQFNLYSKRPFARSMIYVNALTGDIEFVENLIHTGNSEGTAVTAYSDTQRIVADSLPTTFRLRDDTRGNGVETYNTQKTRNFGAAIDFEDADNFWNNANVDLDEYATDAHWGTEMFYDYLDSAFGRNSIDDSGFTLKSYVHVDVDLVNAFWNGDHMSYGDGDTSTNTGPLTTLDIVGHEITHGLTDYTSDLIYANESGALNESFSDIFGTTLEFWARPGRANWEVGEDIGRSFRSMEDPKKFNDPDTYGGQHWIDQNCIPIRANDRCGVHTNSGVQNKWFYLLSEGEIGVNDNADSFNVTGLGMKKAEQIAYRNLAIYLSPSSNYADARFFSIISAIDLYGACSPEVEAVTNAWYAVGVGAEYEDSVSASFGTLTDTIFCAAPVDVEFISTGSNIVELKWEFENGDTSSIWNPTISFDSLGTYDVSLIADGGACGSDTVIKPNYIVIDTNAGCSFKIEDNVEQVVSDCRGRLFDSGGLSGDYDSFEDGLFTIDVPDADYIILDFSIYDVESVGSSCSRDYIEVFDGPSHNSKSFGRFCSANMPKNNQLTSSSNVLSIQFSSDQITVGAGFLIEWECQKASQLPSVDFSVSSDSTCRGYREFFNLSTNGSIDQKWFFGDGKTSNDIHPTHEYQKSGTYDVKLVVENSLGTDSISKLGIVNVDILELPEFQNDTVCVGEDVSFGVSSSEQVAWYRDTNLIPILLGDSLTITDLQRDTTVYVREMRNNAFFNGGKPGNSSQGVYSNDNDYILFDVHRPVLIESILFFSNRSGNRALEVRNHRGELVISKSVFMPQSPLFVKVDLELLPDTSYRISISERDIDLFKDTAGASFPYSISDLITLRGTNLPNGHYPYFYQWKVKEQDCESKFQAINVSVDTSCHITSIVEEVGTSGESALRVYPNPFNDQFILSSANVGPQMNLNLRIYTLDGKLILRRDNLNLMESGQEVKLDLSVHPSGVYYIHIVGKDFVSTRKLIKSR